MISSVHSQYNGHTIAGYCQRVPHSAATKKEKGGAIRPGPGPTKLGAMRAAVSYRKKKVWTGTRKTLYSGARGGVEGIPSGQREIGANAVQP